MRPQPLKKNTIYASNPHQDQQAGVFLFINSKSRRFQGDCVFEDGEITGLPKSSTGKSIVSFSTIIKYRRDQIKLFKATKISRIPLKVAADLLSHAEKTDVLTLMDKNAICEGLKILIETKS